jgi:hypothetical protein
MILLSHKIALIRIKPILMRPNLMLLILRMIPVLLITLIILVLVCGRYRIRS